MLNFLFFLSMAANGLKLEGVPRNMDLFFADVDEGHAFIGGMRERQLPRPQDTVSRLAEHPLGSLSAPILIVKDPYRYSAERWACIEKARARSSPPATRRDSGRVCWKKKSGGRSPPRV